MFANTYRRANALVAALFLSALLACDLLHHATPAAAAGPGTAATTYGSCAQSSSCVDYTGASYNTVSAIQQACTASSAIYSASACDTANRTGSCSVFAGTDNAQILRFYSTGTSPITTDQEQTVCASLINAQYTPN